MGPDYLVNQVVRCAVDPTVFCGWVCCRDPPSYHLITQVVVGAVDPPSYHLISQVAVGGASPPSYHLLTQVVVGEWAVLPTT